MWRFEGSSGSFWRTPWAVAVLYKFIEFWQTLADLVEKAHFRGLNGPFWVIFCQNIHYLLTSHASKLVL